VSPRARRRLRKEKGDSVAKRKLSGSAEQGAGASALGEEERRWDRKSVEFVMYHNKMLRLIKEN
jgi:hypothetical protein